MDRSDLGPADVDDATLARMVADLLGHDVDELLQVDVERVAYDVPSLTTAGRYWVSGRAATPAGEQPFRLFVKHVQAWHRSPFFAELAGLPAEVQELAKASYPWRTEPLAYASDLGDRLPEGLSMPRAVGVFEFEPESAAIWLEPVEHPPVPWDLERYRRAAYLLGRLAASPAVAELGNVGRFEWTLMQYVNGRLGFQVVPMLMDDDLWRHPTLTACFDDDLRERLRWAAGRAEVLGHELLDLPEARAHGDASPGNLMPGPGPGSFVLIDFGLWHPQPVGFDLGQLVAGDVQLGRREAASLTETDEACVVAYAERLAAEGFDVGLDVVRRAHALQLLLFAGLSAPPFDELGSVPEPALSRLSAERAVLARFSLDLLDSTA